MVDVFLHRYEDGTLKPVEVILRRAGGERKNNGRVEPNQGTLYSYMEIYEEGNPSLQLTQTNKNVF
jgi:hypothetical protein